jgi:hypothetical protein
MTTKLLIDNCDIYFEYRNDLCPVHLLDEGVSSQEDASTSSPSSSGFRGLSILKRAFSANFKMLW